MPEDAKLLIFEMVDIQQLAILTFLAGMLDDSFRYHAAPSVQAEDFCPIFNYFAPISEASANINTQKADFLLLQTGFKQDLDILKVKRKAFFNVYNMLSIEQLDPHAKAGSYLSAIKASYSWLHSAESFAKLVRVFLQENEILCEGFEQVVFHVQGKNKLDKHLHELHESYESMCRLYSLI